MQKLLLLWDSRRANSYFIEFIESLRETSLDFDIELTILQIDHIQDIDSGRIKYGMRNLLDQVHRVQPDMITCFGSQANILGKLIRPALRIPLVCNQMPECIDSTVFTSATIDKFTQKFSEYLKWDLNKESYTFIPTMLEKKNINGRIAVMSDDPIGPALTNIIQQQNLIVQSLIRDNVLNHHQDVFESIELFALSNRADIDGRLIHAANACGIPVILISQGPMAQLIKDGYNGWVISSIEDVRLLRCLRNWHSMSGDAKKILSQYSQEMQSRKNGIHYFFKAIGAKERGALSVGNKVYKIA